MAKSEIQLKVEQITKANEKAIKEGKKILKLLPEKTYSWFYFDLDKPSTNTHWSNLNKDFNLILKYKENDTINFVKYIVTRDGKVFIEIKSDKHLIYIPSNLYIRTSGACWSERVWITCFIGQQEFIGFNLYIHMLLKDFKDIIFDLSRMNILYYQYIDNHIYDENDIDRNKEQSDFFNIGKIDLEQTQKNYLDIVSWVTKDTDINNHWTKLYNQNNGVILINVLNFIEAVKDTRYLFNDEYMIIPVVKEMTYYDLQKKGKYDLSVITKNFEKEELFKKPFHSDKEAFELFIQIKEKYSHIFKPIIHNLPKDNKDTFNMIYKQVMSQK